MITNLVRIFQMAERHGQVRPVFLVTKIAVLLGFLVLVGWGGSTAQAGPEQDAVRSASMKNQQDETPTADLSVIQTDATDPIFLGDWIEYTITVANHGPDLAANVVITDTMPSGTNFNFATLTRGSCGIAIPLLVCELGTLNPGDTATLTLRVTPTAAGTFTNQVEAASDTADPDSSNNIDSETTTVNLPQADVSVAQSDDADPILLGGYIQYTITIANNGPDPAANVVITDTMPGGTNFNFATLTRGSCGIAFPLLVCELGTLDPGDTATLTLRVTPTAAGTFTNQVEVTSDTEDPNTANNADSETTTVTGFNFTGFLGSVKNPPSVNLAKAGAAIKFRFRLGGDQGLNIFAPGYPASIQVDCSSGAPLSPPEASASASSLIYDSARDVYIYIWKANGAWRGTCREFILRLNDGSQYTALFLFR